MASLKREKYRFDDAHIVGSWPQRARFGAKALRPDLHGTSDHSGKALWLSHGGGSGLVSCPIHLEGFFQDPLALDRMIVSQDPLFNYWQPGDYYDLPV